MDEFDHATFAFRAYDHRTAYVLSLIREAKLSGADDKKAIQVVSLYTGIPYTVVETIRDADFDFPDANPENISSSKEI